MIITIKDIKPFVRYAHLFEADENTDFTGSIPFEGRLFYCHSGRGEIISRQQVFPMTKGSLLLINSGVDYQIENTKATYIGINFDYTFDHSHLESPIFPMISKDDASKAVLPKYEFSDISELNDTIYIQNFQSIESKLLLIVSEYTSKFNLFRYETSNILSSVIIDILREKRNPKIASQTKFAKEIIKYIQQNYSQNLTNQKIADEFHFHPNYINRLVKESTEMSVHQYLLQIRISKAIDLLITKNYSIEKISQMCGFYDISHFSKCFKRIVSLNPSEFVKNVRN